MLAKSMSLAEIAAILDQPTVPQEILALLAADSRKSVIELLQRRNKREEKEQQERARIHGLFHYERDLAEGGHTLIAGIDEAGRGPLAGPVVVASVMLPMGCYLPQLNDSKKLSSKQREALYDQIYEIAVAISSVTISHEIIDKVNIYQATVQGMYQSLAALEPLPHAVLIDAVKLPKLEIPTRSLIGGDALSASIGAASIIAKVSRDRLMMEYDKQYPEYGFAKHKGYGTAEHLTALHQYGPCPIHRRTFEPIKSMPGPGERDYEY